MQEPRGETAFEAVYRAHQRQVLAYCRRRVEWDLAEDATGETFLVAWRRWDDLPDEPATRAWLYGVARRVLANRFRAARRHRTLTAKLRSDPTGHGMPEDHLVAHDEQQRALTALARLGPDDQEVVRLALWEELSHAEIAAVMGCTEPAVTQRLYRARRRLARELRGLDGGRRLIRGRSHG